MLRIRSTFAFLTVFAAGIAACVHPAGAAPGSCTEPVTLGTTISSTGYGTDDYSVYGSAALTIVILLMFVGGCEKNPRMNS